MGDENDAGKLIDAQREREQRERLQAEQAEDEPEARQHERRSEKAHYLREKLQERAASEHDDN